MMEMRLLASLLKLLLLLFMAHPCVGASGREMVVVFKGGQTEVPFQEDNGTITKRKPLAFRIPAFVGGIFNSKEFLMVLCNARYKSFSDGSFIDAAARTSYGDYKAWSDAEIVANNTRNITNTSVIGDLTTVIKGNKIYVLALCWNKLDSAWFYPKDSTVWDPLMIVGTVMNRTESNGAAGVYVKWDSGSSLKSVISNTVLVSTGVWFVGGAGNGVVTKNGTIIFPIQIANNGRQYASSIMYSTDNGSSWHIGGTTEQGTSYCSVAEWGDDNLLLSVRYDNGVRIIYESDDMGTTWKEYVMLSRVWGNDPNRKGGGSQGSLITVPVDGKDVLLFSHPLNTKGGRKRDTLQLWMSDGQRIMSVGTISEDGKGERSGHSILRYVDDKLYIVHEINPYGDWNNYNAPLEEWDRVIALSSLPDLFDSIKSTARSWRKVDKELNDKSVPINGLVGFLAGSQNNTVWEDKYNCVHANVNGATPVPGGFRFDDTQGSVAQWPVESQGQNQFYIFTETQFTLAATVTIHNKKEAGDHLLLGASMDAAGTQVFIGLGYTQDNRWSVADANGMIMTTGVSFELEKEYHVAIIFENRAVSVYLDGVLIINWRKLNYGSSTMSHFFMGGIGKPSTAMGCLCTVKNVMLYNRVLNKSEIDGLKNVEKDVNKTESISMTILTDMLFASQTITTMDPKKETADPGSHMIPDEDESDDEEINAFLTSARSTENAETDSEGLEKDCDDLQHHSNDRDFKKEEKHIDESVVPFSFTTWLCFVCSAIVLVGF